MKKKTTLYLAQAGVIAALYVALTYLSRLLGIADNAIQFRLSEALTILPVFTPAAVPGLVVGCVLGNLTSPLGWIDIVAGSCATLGAALAARNLGKFRIKQMPLLSALMPALFNGLIVGLELTFLLVPGSSFAWIPFLTNFGTVALGELVVVYALGVPLALTLEKTGAAKQLFRLK